MSLAVLEIPRKNLRRLEANERPSTAAIFVRVPSTPAFLNAGPAVVPCTTFGSGVLLRNVFPVPFELKFRLLSFRTTVFNLRNNLFYDDFIWSWRQTAIWSLNYWILVFMEMLNANFERWSSKYYPKLSSSFKLELQWMCHWIRIVSQLMFKCCYFDFVYCNFVSIIWFLKFKYHFIVIYFCP